MRLLAIVVSLLVGNHIDAQEPTAAIRARNMHYIDSVRHVVETYYCHDLVYPASYEGTEVRKMETLLAAINVLSENGLTESQVNRAFSKIPASRRYGDTASNGLSRIINSTFDLPYGYAETHLVYIDSFLITTRISLHPLTTVRCHGTGDKYLDFNFVGKNYGQELNFPIRLIDKEYIYIRKIDLDNLGKAADRHPDYNFFKNYLADSSGTWIDSMMVALYDPDSACCYSDVRGEYHMVRLIREGRFDLIRDMVFSPGYIYAINAMEAMEYLESIGRIAIDERTKQRFSELKAGNGRLHFEHVSDVDRSVEGYKGVKDHDKLAVMKYRNSFAP